MATTDLIALIKEKQAQIAQLQAELDEARALLLGTSAPLKSGTRIAQGEPGTKSGNSTELAVAVLREAREPLHVNVILTRISQRFGQTVKYATLVGNLARLVKARKTFHRFGPNVYGLIEWSKEGQQLKLRA